MTMTPELQATIDEAYRIFAPYTIGSTLIVCNCNVCMTKETERELVRTPLRTIPSKLLAEYTNSAHSWDDDQVAREMRYFLPRYLELIALGDPPDNLELDICLRRLAYAQWRSKWPAAQVEVLDNFFDRLIEASAQRLDVIVWKQGASLAFDMADLLTMVVTAHGDIGRVLAAWDRAPDPGAAIHMAPLLRHVLLEKDRTYFSSPYLDDYQDAADQIGAFLTRPVVPERIEASFFLTDDPRLQRILSDAA
jgi:hypothetical protein